MKGENLTEKPRGEPYPTGNAMQMHWEFVKFLGAFKLQGN